MPPTPPHPDAIAECVLSAFRALPVKYKPRKLADGRREWVPLAGIVLSKQTDTDHPNCDRHNDTGTPSLLKQQRLDLRVECAALATGMKCLPHAKLREARGNVLHDSHAEVLATRAFNRWLVDECAELARKGVGSRHEWLRWARTGRGARWAEKESEGDGERRSNDEADMEHLQHKVCEEDHHCHQPPFELRPDVELHMFCSDAPCGDASMELIMSAQEDATPWSTPRPTGSQDGEHDNEDAMLGRGHFSRLGIVRRKPARPDAPVTLSKSCSDKLALKQCTSLLCGVASLLVRGEGCYLRTLVLPEGQVIAEAVERAFGTDGKGRMRDVTRDDVQRRWREMGAGFAFRPFDVTTTRRVFEYGKQLAAGVEAQRNTVPSNLSVLYTLGCGERSGRQEILTNGVLQGRKQLDPKGASCASRRRMWEGVVDVLRAAGVGTLAERVQKGTYAQMKGSEQLAPRKRVKRDVLETSLKGWKANLGDDDWML